MSILISQSGKVSVNTLDVNQVLAPVEIGNFTISRAAAQFIDEELSEHNVINLFQFIPEDLKNLCKDRKLIPTKASIFKTQVANSLSQTRSDVSQTPHINEGDELHFFFAGSYIIYFNINNQHYSLVVEAGDWLFIPANIEHWIKSTEDHYLVIVSYHCEPFDIFHTKVKYTTTKSNAFLR